ncbi:hypothetical protein ACWN83_09455 [Pseudolactococcus plantarum]|uniref:hypothetical protein n=1 Tax=Pseudolactococcus plantarum TaxID=1365 RepID=UPI0008337DFA|nr:hypothetical protein [Lactococcus plantarum]
MCKEAAFEILVHNHEQELRFLKLWDEDAQPYYFESQPQLTIPKSIKESSWMKHLLSCDLSQFEFERFDEFLNKDDEQFLKWVNTGKNENILYIYLAGKAIGVDLVKVVEG